MKLSDFDFNLPQELIAQHPADKRDESSLLVVRPVGHLIKCPFKGLPNFLCKGDLIVFNDTKVIKAKLGLKQGNGVIDLYLNRPLSKDKWLGFLRPAKKVRDGDIFHFGEHKVIIDRKLDMGEVEISFELKGISLFDFLEIYGEVPLPPYIKRDGSSLGDGSSNDEERYQTVYSKNQGSVAAPTAGLHFTQELLDTLDKMGVEKTYVTLHVGAGTFLPVKTEDIHEHKMHPEYCEISEDAANKINKARQEGRRIVAVGTTVLRAIESAASNKIVKAGNFQTDIFITPGFKFQMVNILLTNFHLPKSTLFMLVCAFAGYAKMHEAYKAAIENKMRFFSYGDATLLYLGDYSQR